MSGWRESLSCLCELRDSVLGLPGPVLALDGFSLKTSSPWWLAFLSLVGSDKTHVNSLPVPGRFSPLSTPLPDITAPFFIQMGWVLFMMELSWIASFFKNCVKMQKVSASYIRMDKENWTQFWLVSSDSLFWNFSPVSGIPFQTRSVHRPVCGKGPLRLPNVSRNPSLWACSEFLGR